MATAAADIMDIGELNRAVGEVAARLGGLDLLVANAGGTVGSGNLTSAGPGEFPATFALNAGHAAGNTWSGPACLTCARQAGERS